MIDLAELDREIVTRPGAPNRLYEFVKMAWSEVEPAPFSDNWHIGAICEHLEAVTSGEVRNLAINVPPGTSKSLLVSVFWPVWNWVLDPTDKYMFASYDGTLTARHARLSLQLMQSMWFQDRFDLRLTELKPAASDYTNTAGGFRFSTSVGGKATGRHVNKQVIDDPIKPHDVRGSLAVTKKALSAVSEWWKGTASSRRVDASTFARVIVMQRLHEEDLAGEVLAEQGWVHACYPMRYEKTSVCPCKNKDCSPEDPRTEEGELLDPKRYPEEVVVADETVNMGPYVAAAQNQQRPSPATGGIFQKGWFRYWHYHSGVAVPKDDPTYPCRDEFCVVLPAEGQLVQSWDCTFKGNTDSDFVAAGVWFKAGINCYLVDQICERMTFVETCEALLALTKKHPKALTKYVEDKANGTAVENVMKETVPGIDLVNPAGGKEARAHSVSGLFKSGNVYIPHPDIAPWVKDYRSQMTGFPKTVNDDMVDQTTQALVKLAPSKTTFIEAMKAVREQTKNGQV